MFYTVLIYAAVLFVLFLIVVALRPDEFRVIRSTTISASPETVFSFVNDVHKFQEWNPWAKLDSNCKNSFAGPSAGVGAMFSWSGNKKVGEGSMTITESHPNNLVRMKLVYLKPFAGESLAEFIVKSNGTQTVISWSNTGKSNFICKAMGIFVSMDKMIGGMFGRGLADLKLLSEDANKNTESVLSSK